MRNPTPVVHTANGYRLAALTTGGVCVKPRNHKRDPRNHVVLAFPDFSDSVELGKARLVATLETDMFDTENATVENSYR